MIRSKTWVKDRYFDYEIGDLVKLVRKKKNGHPRGLNLGKSYKIVNVQNEDLFVTEIDAEEINGGTYTKVNKHYFAPVERMRDQIINEILGND
jgi:hypothetical protein